MLEKYDNWKLLEMLFQRPLYPFHLREICRILKWSPIKVRSILNGLKKDNIITETKEKNLSIFKLNRENETMKRYKMIYNLYNAFEMADFLDKKIGFFDAIILFGSASRGEDIENSDFDICVVGGKEIEIDVSMFERKINRKISLFFVENLEELREKNPELLNNLINGIVLKGYLKVI